MDLIRSSGLLIPLNEFRFHPSCIHVKGHLTRTFKDYNSEESTITFRFYIQSDKYLVVPRFFPFQNYFSQFFHITDKREDGKDVNIRYSIKPKDDFQEECLSWFSRNSRGILHAGTGSGKTIMAIKTICDKGKKAIIFVHKVSLVKQWYERFESFTDVVSKNNISILKSESYEKDLLKDIIITTNQTFLSLVKRKRYDFLKVLRNSGIGTLFGDEVHTTVGAPSFSLCSLYVSAKNTFGLTATPYRYDGCHDVIKYHLGEIYKPTLQPSTMKPKIMVIFFDHRVAYGKTEYYIYWQGKFSRSRYLNMMYKSDAYINLCLTLIRRAVNNNRYMLFLHDRIRTLEKLIDMAEINEENVGRFYRSAPLNETEKPFIFATPGKCRDGIDIPPCDLLIMGNSIGNAEQAIGRIVREMKGKEQPIVIDLVDTGCEDMLNRYSSRRNLYDRESWEVEEYEFNENNQLVMR